MNRRECTWCTHCEFNENPSLTWKWEFPPIDMFQLVQGITCSARQESPAQTEQRIQTDEDCRQLAVSNHQCRLTPTWRWVALTM